MSESHQDAAESRSRSSTPDSNAAIAAARAACGLPPSASWEEAAPALSPAAPPPPTTVTAFESAGKVDAIAASLDGLLADQGRSPSPPASFLRPSLRYASLEVPVSSARPAGRRMSRRSTANRNRSSLISRISSAASSLSGGEEGESAAATAGGGAIASGLDASLMAAETTTATAFPAAAAASLPPAPSHRQASWFLDALRSGMSEREIARVFGLEHDDHDGGDPDSAGERAAGAAAQGSFESGDEGDDDPDLFDSEEVLQQRRVLAILEARRMTEELLGKGWEERRPRLPTPEEEEEEERGRVARFPVPDAPAPVIDPPPAVVEPPRRHPRDYRPPRIPPSAKLEAMRPPPQEPVLLGRVIRRSNSGGIRNDNGNSSAPNDGSGDGGGGDDDDDGGGTRLEGAGGGNAGTSSASAEEEVEVTCHGCRKSLAVGYLALLVRCPECAAVSPAVPWWPPP